MSTSQEAYNGCLSLYSAKERLARGDVTLFVKVTTDKRVFAKGYFQAFQGNQYLLPSHCLDMESSRVIGKGFGAYLHQLRKNLIESQKTTKDLPNLNLESIEDIILAEKEDTLDELESHSTTFIESSKIQVVQDPRSLLAFKGLFRQLPWDFISHVWTYQNHWGACFDILSSIKATDHTSFTFTFVFDPIADPVSWPTLQTAYPRRIIHSQSRSKSRSRSNSDRSILLIRDSDFDFEMKEEGKEGEEGELHEDVISLTNSSLSGFSWHICSKQKDIDESDEIQSITNISEASWEMLPDDQDESTECRDRTYSEQSHVIEGMVDTSLPIAPPSPLPLPLLSTPPVENFSKSYKDALLSQSKESISTNSTSENLVSLNYSQLTALFPVKESSYSPYPYPLNGEEIYDVRYEDDTYVDWLETAYGSKETSIAALNRGRSHCVKASHERKRQSSKNYHRKYARG